ncbi:hypothetical protein NQ317_002284 [Molorchus minor]|uniref:Uncharacterized protein n=1 Tax=Molorchus minor TaxID=1323400 RepID=A0ABQ9JLT5_9CUCU|nr:hypothetical protein NQ317_002284 [Molorchus minor]
MERNLGNTADISSRVVCYMFSQLGQDLNVVLLVYRLTPKYSLNRDNMLIVFCDIKGIIISRRGQDKNGRLTEEGNT